MLELPFELQFGMFLSGKQMDPIIKNIKEFPDWAKAKTFLAQSSSHFVTARDYPHIPLIPKLVRRVLILGDNRKTGFLHLPSHARQKHIVAFCQLAMEKEPTESSHLDLPGFLESFTENLRDQADLKGASNHIVAQIAELFLANGASILLLTEDQSALRYVASYSSGPEVSPREVGLDIPVGSGIAGWAASTRKPLLVPKVKKDQPLNAFLAVQTHFHRTDVIAAPILLGEELLGVLEVANGEQHFAEWHLPTLCVVASVVAIFLEKAQLSLQRKRVQNAEGKAENASSALHNIGNVINSVNVACSSMISGLEKSRLDRLTLAIELIRKNEANLALFFSENPKGKLLPEFFYRINEQLIGEHAELLEEIRKVGSKAQLMQDIIETQQMISKFGSSDTHDLIQVLEEALLVQNEMLKRKRITIIKDLRTDKLVSGLKSKIIHVLINLIKNGVESMDATPATERSLTFEMGVADQARIYLKIKDTGCGILKENLANLFVHGFTTKSDGHGYGLASCARIMEDMNGSIEADSEGAGKGSSFTVFFPSLDVAGR